MTVTYRIDQAKRRIHTRCIGAVTLDEVLQHFADLVRDPDCPARLDVLLDLSEITSLPTSSQLTAVTTEVARVRPRVQFDGCANHRLAGCALRNGTDVRGVCGKLFRGDSRIPDGGRGHPLAGAGACSSMIRCHASYDIGPNEEVLT